MKCCAQLRTLETAYKVGSEDMTPLLKEVLDAHGGLTQWKRFTKISATIRSRGDLWEMKGVPQDPSPRQMSASLDKEWSSVFPYGAPDKLTDFTPNRVAIVTVDGALVAERFDPAEQAYQLIRQEGPIVDRTFEIEFLDLGVLALDFTFG